MKWDKLQFFLGMFFLISIISCAGAKPQPLVKKDVPPLIVRTDVFEGLVSVDGQSVYLITNYKSRSRVDYLVTGNLKSKMAALDGQIVTVEGTAKRRGWSGTIRVTRIIKPKQSATPSSSGAKK